MRTYNRAAPFGSTRCPRDCTVPGHIKREPVPLRSFPYRGATMVTGSFSSDSSKVRCMVADSRAPSYCRS